MYEMEVAANEVFPRYAKMYYDKDFITSVYFFESGVENGYGSCWLVKKSKFINNFIFILFFNLCRCERRRRRRRRERCIRFILGCYSCLQPYSCRR